MCASPAAPEATSVGPEDSGPPRWRISGWTKTFLWWAGISGLFLSYFLYAIFAERTPAKAVLTPGETTHGHYQIELACNACHTPLMGVNRDACLDCHAEELRAANDTHPAKKFNDPTNADRLAVLNVKECITCHREHVPHRTHPMGLSLPPDYCYHCHQDVGEQRPSHAEFAYDSCATAGCHNYHDNTALYENFLIKHWGEPDVLDDPRVPARSAAEVAASALTAEQHDAPADLQAMPDVVHDWADTAHAQAGVNCRGCHASGESRVWRNDVDHQACEGCHKTQVSGFLSGKHGARLAQALSPMTPGAARQPMKDAAFHKKLSCTSCHADHRFDTRFAAVDACLTCHDDEHSRAYKRSKHYQLWLEELSGAGAAGTGVSCATCHLPRGHDDDGAVMVQHNQNDNLRPNEKMVRSSCNYCHGVAFSIDALADGKLIKRCFEGSPEHHVPSVDMAKDWFEAKARKRRQRATKSSSSP